MVIDFHTHIFPPGVRDGREDYLRRDALFAEMYSSPKAKIATAEDLLRSMDEAGINVSVALGFAWRDQEECVRHNDYLLEAAAASAGRIVPFCTLNPAAGEAAVLEGERCLAAGAPGLGELRPESQGWDLNGEAGERLAALARRHGLLLLFHVTEEGGHDYPGKRGLKLESFLRFALSHRDVQIVGAHLAGGLALQRPEDPPAFADTAAFSFLYKPPLLTQIANGPWASRLLFGSDFPLVTQARALAEVRAAVSEGPTLTRLLGDNARALLP